jgi:hypothetical protein
MASTKKSVAFGFSEETRADLEFLRTHYRVSKNGVLEMLVAADARRVRSEQQAQAPPKPRRKA